MQLWLCKMAFLGSALNKSTNSQPIDKLIIGEQQKKLWQTKQLSKGTCRHSNHIMSTWITRPTMNKMRSNSTLFQYLEYLLDFSQPLYHLPWLLEEVLHCVTTAVIFQQLKQKQFHNCVNKTNLDLNKFGKNVECGLAKPYVVGRCHFYTKDAYFGGYLI